MSLPHCVLGRSQISCLQTAVGAREVRQIVHDQLMNSQARYKLRYGLLKLATPVGLKFDWLSQ